MKSTPRHFLTAYIIFLSIACSAFANASSIVVTVVTQAGEQQFSIPEIKGNQALLPIFYMTQKLLFRADWNGADQDGTKELYISLQDPTTIVPGIAGPNGTVNPGPLIVYSATMPLSIRQRILVFKSPEYSLWFQIDDDKK